MILVREILGHVGDQRFAGRQIDRLPVAHAEAARSRFRARTEAGTDVGIALPRGAYLAEGAVLADDGERIVVVERTPEEVAVVRLDAAADCAPAVADAVRLGHAFGNQHVPLEVTGDEVLIPVTTSRDVVAETVRTLGLTRAALSFDSRPFARQRPPVGAGEEQGAHS